MKLIIHLCDSCVRCIMARQTFHIVKDYCFCFRKTNFILLLIICILLYLVIMKEEEAVINAGHVSWLKLPPDKVYYFSIDSDNIINTVDRRFLSFSIDTSQIYKGLRNPSLSNNSLKKRVAHLGGGYLRVGGTAADMLVFSPSMRAWPETSLPVDGGVCSNEHTSCLLRTSNQHTIKKFSMSAEDWHEINEFSKYVDLKLLFDLNVLLRNKTNNEWSYHNAEYLIDYSYAYQYDIDWQLGNEPNSFLHVFGVEVPGEKLAKDFNTLRKLLNRYGIYNASKLVGPDITNPRSTNKSPVEYLASFLASGPEISAATWHHYYTGPTSSVDFFLNVSLYEEFTENCRTIINLVREKTPSKPVWITETGSAYGGGAESISDRFVGSFLWIDKLGVAAREGVSLVVRQSLYSGIYSLLNSQTLKPNPDYWVSILYKSLVGRKVLNVSCDSCSSKSALRVYGHCSKRSPRAVFFGLNLSKVPIGLSLPLNTSTTALLYSLTSLSLTSNDVELNGDKLYLTFTDALPKLRPIVITLDRPVIILPYSIFFLEVDVILNACL
ncbi:hypothetical protein O3M35_010351 [Rhynocoris fuscipes]|uniref:Heparanase n=1 Tax=Rhynocoris fuscipes TaxID=488301 RepID=A0AAW1D0V3_9HEMI